MPSLVPILEAAAADLLHHYTAALRATTPGSTAECLALGLAAACYAGVGHPLTTVKGLGPRLTAAELSELENFYGQWNATPVLELAPWLDPASFSLLESRGYQRIGEEEVMLRATGTVDHPATTSVEIVEDVPAWARSLALAFHGEANDFWLALGLSMGHIAGSRLLGVREQDELLACAQLVPGLRIATFCCDGTLESARGRGYQRLLIEARLSLAQELGLAWCTSEVAPGSTSQRNYQRCGFEKVYSRQHWSRQPQEKT